MFISFEAYLFYSYTIVICSFSILCLRTSKILGWEEYLFPGVEIRLHVFCFYTFQDFNVFYFYALQDFNVFYFYALQDFNVLCFYALQDFNVFYFYALQDFNGFCFYALQDFMSSVFYALQDFNVNVLYFYALWAFNVLHFTFFIGLQGLLFCLIRLQCLSVLSASLFCFLHRVALNNKIARMKLMSLSLLIFYFQ